MKKFLTIAAVAAFVFTLAAATYAVDFGASGLIRARTAVYENSNGWAAPGTANWDSTQSFVESRFRLQMKLTASEDLYGVVYFEGDSTAWGDVGAGRNQAGGWGAGHSDRAAVELKQFYIDFKIPGISEFAPTRLRAGTQWLAIRSHVFLGADGAGLRFFTEAGPIRVYLNWFKPAEMSFAKGDDTDLYAVRAVLALPDFPVTPGMFVAYWHGNEYPMNVADTAMEDADFYWIGVNADGKIGPASFKADFIYLDGEVEQRVATAANPDLDYSAWLFYADASVPISMFTVGATFMYATGNDLSEVGASQDRDGYVIPPGSEANPVLGVVFWASAEHDGIDICGGSNGARTGNDTVQPRWYGGLWTVKGYASIKPLDWLKVTGFAMYIGDTVDNGNAIGNARTAAGLPEDDDYIGIEVGAIADIKIYKELVYSVGVGYLFAGDALDSWNAGTARNESPNDPWAIISQLLYKF